MQTAEANRRFGEQTILFVDEIHRFNRSQQDALLHAVEDRILVLVGATTENPFFEVNSALISRSRVVELHALSDEDLSTLIDRALADERGLGGRYALDDEARNAIVLMAGGDGRGAVHPPVEREQRGRISELNIVLLFATKTQDLSGNWC